VIQQNAPEMSVKCRGGPGCDICNIANTLEAPRYRPAPRQRPHEQSAPVHFAPKISEQAHGDSEKFK
jgi:hypothetical protein